MKALSKLCAALMVAALAGCASQPKPLYHWGSYQRQVYEYLNADESTSAEQLAVLQTQFEKASTADAALPPGFRAHLGMLHLRMGQYGDARKMFEAEKSAFPESSQYMDFVLNSMSEKKS